MIIPAVSSKPLYKRGLDASYKRGLDASAGNSLGIIMSYLSIQFSPPHDDFVTEGAHGLFCYPGSGRPLHKRNGRAAKTLVSMRFLAFDSALRVGKNCQ